MLEIREVADNNVVITTMVGLEKKALTYIESGKSRSFDRIWKVAEMGPSTFSSLM